MLNVLITGCAGYVGSVATRLFLEKGYRVIGLDNLSFSNAAALLGHLGHRNFTFVRGDVCHGRVVEELTHKADVVVHLAALVGAPLCARFPDVAEAVNCQATAHLAGRLQPSQRLVFATTQSGYGARPDGKPVTEEAAMTPVSAYGLSKAGAEQAVRQHPFHASLRLATVFGCSPRMRFDLLVNDFTERLASGSTLRLFEPGFRRNYLHVRDAARALLFFAQTGYVGTYNVGLPEALTKQELAEAVCEWTGAKKDLLFFGEGQDPDRRDYVVSVEKLLSTTFRLEHTLADGVRDVAAFVRNTHVAARETMRNA